MQLLAYLNLRFWRCCLSWEWCPTNRAISGWHNTNWSKLQNVLVCNNLVLVCTAAPPLSFSILKVDTAVHHWGEATLLFGTKHVKTSITAFLIFTLTSRVKFQYFSHDRVAWRKQSPCVFRKSLPVFGAPLGSIFLPVLVSKLCFSYR